MTIVTIEQTPEGSQTYFRLHGIGHGVDDPCFRISRSASAETLGPDGWKNIDQLISTKQFLDGEDLLLEVGAKLINPLDPGQPIEVQVPGLKLVERVLTPQLVPMSDSAVGEARATERIPFGRTAQPPAPQPPPEPPT